MKPIDSSTKPYYKFKCSPCEARFKFVSDSSKIHCYWFTKGEFSVQFNEPDSKFRLYKKGDLILTLDTIPDITPQNFKDKIKTYLLFL
jgi:hypothetical protein